MTIAGQTFGDAMTVSHSQLQDADVPVDSAQQSGRASAGQRRAPLDGSLWVMYAVDYRAVTAKKSRS